jgi:hypothetical protein
MRGIRDHLPTPNHIAFSSKRKIAFCASDGANSDNRNIDPLKAVWKCEAKLVFAAFKPLQIAP